MEISAIFDAVNLWDATPLRPVNKSKSLFERTMGGSVFQFAKLDQETRWDLGMQAVEIITLFAPLVEIGIDMRAAVSGEGDEDEVNMQRAKYMINKGAPLIANLNDPRFKDYIRRLWQQASFEIEGGLRESLTVPNAAEKAFDKDLTMRIPVALSVMEVNLKDGFLQSPIAKSLLARLKSDDQNSENTSEIQSKAEIQSTSRTEAS